jgi:hypothetical protein
MIPAITAGGMAMRELSDADYDALKRAPAVRAGLAGIESRREAAKRRFWIVLPTGAVLLAGQFWFFWQRDMAMVGTIILVLGALATWLTASWGLMSVNEALKEGILTEAARMVGLRYAKRADEHPVMTEAQAFLFHTGGTPLITDLLDGEEEGGRKLSFFEMGLSHTTRRNNDDDDETTVTDFAGQMFAFSRAEPGEGVVAVRPAAGLLGSLLSQSVSVEMSGFKAVARSVEFGEDPPFDAAFDIVASDPDLAEAVLTPEIRRLLLELRAVERVWFYCGPKSVLIGLWGSNRFEGGGMLQSGTVEDRVRAMIDDLNDSVRMARRLLEVIR